MLKSLRIIACLLATLTAFAQTPPESLSEKSSTRAREVLAAGIKAMGGLEALKSIRNISREMAGERTDEGQGLRPIPHRGDYYHHPQPPVINHPRMQHVNDVRGQRTSESLEDTILGGQPLKFRNILSKDGAIQINYALGTFEVRQLPNPAQARADRLNRYPENLLPLLSDRPEMLRYLGESTYDGRPQQVICYAHPNVGQITLFFDTQTRLLTKSEVLTDNQVLGDTADEVVFDDWRAVGNLKLPFRYIDKVGGVMLQDLRASSITVDGNLDESLFNVPTGLTKFERTPLARKVTKLGEDVYLAPGGYNSVFIVFNDYVLVLEAGSDNQSSEGVIAQIKATAPGKPIRHLVSTHFHFDHLGGVRSYIAEGTNIVTTSGAKQSIEQAATALHLRRYDQYALRAFEAQALDYLLKPFDEERFQKTLARAKTLLRRQGVKEIGKQLLALLQEHEASRHFLDRLVIKAAGRIFFLDVAEVGWIEAADNYVHLHVGREAPLLRDSLNGLAAKLDPSQFLRIRHSAIVNLKQIKELRPLFRGEYSIILRDGTEIISSRRYRKNLDTILGK